MKIPFSLSRQATLWKDQICVGQSPLDFHRSQRDFHSCHIRQQHFLLFWLLFWDLVQGKVQVPAWTWHWMGQPPVCQLPTRGLIPTAQPCIRPRIPSNLWSRQLIVLDLWLRIAASAWGQLSMPMAGAGEHAAALWRGDCLAFAPTLVSLGLCVHLFFSTMELFEFRSKF